MTVAQAGKKTPTNVGPPPSRFAVDTDREGHLNDVAKCSLATLLRLGAGALVDGYTFALEKQEGDIGYALVKAGPFASVEGGRGSGSRLLPEQALVLFAKMDGPGRKVREALSILDLDCVVYPSTRSWERLGFDHRQHSVTLRDPNAGAEFVDPDDTVAYLFKTYGGDAEIPWVLRRDNAIGAVLLKMAIWLRGGAGTRYRGKVNEEEGRDPGNGIDPMEVEFWGYGTSQKAFRVCRSALSVLLAGRFVVFYRGQPILYVS